jgi:siroheme synthase (precorrin-2 oxidase/ferrochelatase)
LLAEHETVTVFPVALDLRGRRCILIGPEDHPEIVGKRAALEHCGARVERIEARDVCEAALCDAFFVLSAIKSPALSSRLRELADGHRFLLWCVDQPRYGFVQMMAIASAGPVRVGISTSGTAPAIGKAFREALEGAMDARFIAFVRRLFELRRHLRERFPAAAQAQQRVEALRRAASGFEVDVAFRYPPWFE